MSLLAIIFVVFWFKWLHLETVNSCTWEQVWVWKALSSLLLLHLAVYPQTVRDGCRYYRSDTETSAAVEGIKHQDAVFGLGTSLYSSWHVKIQGRITGTEWFIRGDDLTPRSAYRLPAGLPKGSGLSVRKGSFSSDVAQGLFCRDDLREVTGSWRHSVTDRFSQGLRCNGTQKSTASLVRHWKTAITRHLEELGCCYSHFYKCSWEMQLEKISESFAPDTLEESNISIRIRSRFVWLKVGHFPTGGFPTLFTCWTSWRIWHG